MYRNGLRDQSLDRILAEGITVDNVGGVLPEPGDNRIAYGKTRENRTDLWLLDEENKTRRITGTEAAVGPGVYPFNNVAALSWHPNGGRLTYGSNLSGTMDIWVADVDTGERTRVTYHPEPDAYPRFSPDKDEIAYITSHRSPTTLAISDLNGMRTEILRSDEYQYTDPQWKDDETLYAVRAKHQEIFDGNCEIVKVSHNGDLEVVFSEPNTSAVAPRPRPDKDELAFLHDGTGYDSLYILGSNQDEPELLYNEKGVELSAPSWNDNGDLVVVAAEQNETSIRVVGRDGEIVNQTDGKARRYFPQWYNGDIISVNGTPTRPFSIVNESTNERLTDGSIAGLPDLFVEPEQFIFEASDDVEIPSMLYLPTNINELPVDDTPVLVHPHGGPQSFYGYDYNPIAQYFTAQGYALVEPNYRGSAGFGRAFRDQNDFEWGERDLQDVIESVNAVSTSYPQIDGDRAGVFGGSGGGLMTVNALGRSDTFSAGAAFYGVFDYESFVDKTDDIGFQLMKRELGFPSTDLENYRDKSPIRAVPSIEAPLLLLHGEDDMRVPIDQSEQLAAELERHDKRYEFIRYPDERHVLTRRENVMDAFTRVADLFAKYLQENPDDGKSTPHTSVELRNSKVPLSPFTHFH